MLNTVNSKFRFKDFFERSLYENQIVDANKP